MITVLGVVSGIAGASAIGQIKIEKTGRPNIVIFFTDDQGFADVGCYDAGGLTTPNLDRLASEGIRFTDFYVAATVCTPSRAALLTGKYPVRVGLEKTVLYPYSNQGLSPEAFNMARMLQQGGYATFCIGKWHLGHEEKHMPNKLGFDEFYGVPYSNDMDGYRYDLQHFKAPPLPLYRNEEVIASGPAQRYLTRMYTEEAIDRIRNRDKEKPFFMYVAHNMPHTPLHVSERFDGKSGKGLYGDVIMELDWSAGEIVKTLKSEGIYENTLFLFTSDNGPQVGSAKPLRGRKAQTWEGGQRVPAIMVWPSVIPASKVCGEVVSTLDLLPTFARIANVPVPEGEILDGRDVTALLRDPEGNVLPDEPFYYFAFNGQLEAVRLGKWKLHVAKVNDSDNRQGVFPVSLYDLEKDIGEKVNVADLHPELVRKLTSLIAEFEY